MRAALHNLGCKVNSYETQAMAELLKEAGFEIVDFEKEAEVYVINTCSVTAMADKKSRQMIHRVRRQNPGACVVAAGCFTQTTDLDVVYECGANIVLGNNEKTKLVSEIDKYFINQHCGLLTGPGEDNKRFVEIVDVNDKDITYESMRITADDNHTRAFIKVQDGCNMYCSYCIIPYARGRIRSRVISDVVEEVTGLADAGYKEVVITGIHLTSYGHGTDETLADLILAVNAINGIERIRLGSLEPRVITEDFLDKIKKADKLCPHFHLSLQSGSATVLERMNRHYSPAEYKTGCDLLRKYFDNPAITTDVIVGFPGETEAEFDETLAFVKDIAFFEMHVFMYSRRAGTKADKMPNQVKEEIKKERSKKLIALADEMSDNYRKGWLDKELEVLIEEEVTIEDSKYFLGHTKEYIQVAVPVSKADASVKPNSIVKVKTSRINSEGIML